MGWGFERSKWERVTDAMPITDGDRGVAVRVCGTSLRFVHMCRVYTNTVYSYGFYALWAGVYRTDIRLYTYTVL